MSFWANVGYYFSMAPRYSFPHSSRPSRRKEEEELWEGLSLINGLCIHGDRFFVGRLSKKGGMASRYPWDHPQK